MNKYMNNNLAGVIFSKDRAMQLEGTIESLFLHCGDISRIELCVLYKASSKLHGFQYNKLKEEFYNISFVEEANFKEQVLDVVSGFEYVLFLVDDNLFVRDFHSADIVKSLQQNNDAIGFSLRLGPNTDYCYARDAEQSVPSFRQVDSEILKYDWTRAEYDFGYPLEVSSSIYRTADILGLFKGAQFSNPNTLEGAMASNSHLYRRTRSCLLCFEHSAAFCAPVNMVQTVWDNRVGGNQNYSADKLAQMFENGRRIDVKRYSGFVPNSCHQEVELYFKGTGEAAAVIGTPPQGVPKRTYGETAAGTVNAGEYDYEQRNLHRKPLGPLAGVSCGKPKFSIVMANYNNAKYIGQAIESVMNQTFSDWELIIEDGSTDGSLEIIKRYLGDRRIRLIQHQSNRGYTAALKAGIANVRSDYFGILDSDDCLVPQAVETMYNWHVELPDCGLIYSQFAFCGEDLTQKKIGFCAEIPPGRTTLDANVVSHFKTFKLRDYLKTSGYDENILYAEDIDIVYKMEEVSGLKFVSDCLYLYRELSSSLCHSPNKINVSIMSRVKARINALKRRCGVLAGGNNQSFERLFRQEVTAARKKHEDVEQYFAILAKLYENGMLEGVNWPDGADKWGREDAVLWLCSHVDIQFDKLFELIGRHKAVGRRQPLICVEMVTYNAERFIRQAIDSVLAQTYQNFELLIVDDGSTDGTAELIGSYSDSRIRYIHTPHRNCASARNRAIMEAGGEYLLCVDSDDFIEPSYIEKMAACVLKYPEIDFFYPGWIELVDQNGNITGRRWDYPDFSDNSSLAAFLFDKGYGPIPNPGSVKKRALFDKVGTYDDVDCVEDFVFLCRNALKISFMRVDDHSTYFYRRVATSSSHNYRARNEIMAVVLNEMVSIYPMEVLCPQIAAISDAALKERRYYEYLMRTFYRHANGNMVQYSEYFERYGDYYKQNLSQITSPGKPVGSAGTL